MSSFTNTKWLDMEAVVDDLSSQTTADGESQEAEKRRWRNELVEAILKGKLSAVFRERPIDPAQPGAAFAAVYSEIQTEKLDLWLGMNGYKLRFLGGAVNADNLGRQKKQILKIINIAKSFKYDPLEIPRGGKKAIKNKCLDEEASLFTDSGFDHAWKAAVKDGAVKMKNGDQYSRKK